MLVETAQATTGQLPLAWVINGPISNKRLEPERRRNGTWIPSSCFSAVLGPIDGHWNALAFIIPNIMAVDGQVSRYLTMVSTINSATSFDLLAGMDEVMTAEVEGQTVTGLW